MKRSALPTLMVIVAMLASCRKPVAPEYIGVENIEVKSFGLKESRLGITVKMFNPNNQRLQIKSADLDLYVNNELLGHSVLDSLVHIPKKDTFYLPLTVNVQTMGTAARLVQSLADTSVLLKVTGVAKLGRSGVFVNYPIAYEGNQKLGLRAK